MFTDRGIGSESWIYVTEDCALKAHAERTQVQFEFGHKTASLNLCVSAAMMPEFARIVTNAFTEHGELVDLRPSDAKDPITIEIPDHG